MRKLHAAQSLPPDRSFLAQLEQLLAQGTARLPGRFVDAQRELVEATQAVDGGFTGRRGRSDIYYTAFGVRLMALTQCPGDARWQHLAAFVDVSWPNAKEPVDVLSLLECRRMLDDCGGRTGATAPDHVTDSLERLRAGDGYSMVSGGELSVYQTFTVLLAYELLDRRMPDLARAADAVLARQTPGGGFAESADGAPGTVNPTCAALVVLAATLRGKTAGLATVLTTALSGRALRIRQAAERAFGFFASLQRDDGGFPTHAAAPCSDLLSTFTVLSVLATADRLSMVRIADVARYVRTLAMPAGGFRPSLLDSDTDVEYTYYGLGALAILARHATNSTLG